MAKELNEDTGFQVSLKTLIGLAVGITTVVGFWFAFQADLDDMRNEIEEAKKLPDPVISREEYDLKDELIRQTILTTQKDVEEIKEKIDKIDDYIRNGKRR
jgi:Fe2+ transport system protein B